MFIRYLNDTGVAEANEQHKRCVLTRGVFTGAIIGRGIHVRAVVICWMMRSLAYGFMRLSPSESISQTNTLVCIIKH